MLESHHEDRGAAACSGGEQTNKQTKGLRALAFESQNVLIISAVKTKNIEEKKTEAEAPK